jgi:hypothetical protein
VPGKVILVAGLLSSRKSTYGRSLKGEIGAADCVDDYHAEWLASELSVRAYRVTARGGASVTGEGADPAEAWRETIRLAEAASLDAKGKNA